MLSIQKQTIIQIHPTIHYILIMLKPTKKKKLVFTNARRTQDSYLLYVEYQS